MQKIMIDEGSFKDNLFKINVLRMDKSSMHFLNYAKEEKREVGPNELISFVNVSDF